MMGVSSYIELYTTLLGWDQYGKIWQIILGTGFIMVPLIAMVINNTIVPYQSQEPRAAHKTSLKRVSIGIAGYMVAVLIAGFPLMKLSPELVRFAPLCGGSAVHASESGTTYDGAISLPQEVRVPILWYAVMSLSHGVTAALNTNMTDCSAFNTRAVQVELDTTKIQDPLLIEETKSFYNACYKPSVVKLFNNHDELSKLRSNEDVVLLGSRIAGEKSMRKATYFDSKYELDWMGSDYLINTSGYYDSFNVGIPQSMTNYEKLNCKQWWIEYNGLHQRLMDEIPTAIYEKLGNVLSYKSDSERKDAIIKKMIQISFPSGLELEGDKHWRGEKNFFSKHIGANFGLFWQQLSYYPKMYLLISSLPWIQSLILMGIYSFSGIVLLFCSFSVKSIIRLSVLIFSLTMLSYIWQLAGYIDQFLISALAPNELISDGTSFKARALVDVIALGLYLGLPMGWMYLMSQAGGNLVAMSAIISSGVAPANEAGSKADALAPTIASKAMMFKKI